MDHSEVVKSWLDWAALGTLVGTFMGWLPNILALLGIVWYTLQIYDWIKKQKGPDQGSSGS